MKESRGGKRDEEDMNAAKEREGTFCCAFSLCHVSSILCTGSANGGIQTFPFSF